MTEYDVVIVGASFSGLTLARHLPKQLRILILEAKPAAGAVVESTGLITEKTRLEFASFFEIDKYTTNAMDSICVVAPGFDDYFVSTTSQPWIYQTDTRALIKNLAADLSENITLKTSTVFLGVDDPENVSIIKIQSKGQAVEEVKTRFLVGADGSRSKVAASVFGLDKNRRFLFGSEQVFFGQVNLGENPVGTVYHFWFGEFSLGYGGWLSPTIINGQPAFRIGLAKLMEDRGQAKELTANFLRVLVDKGYITVVGQIDEPGYIFGSLITIGGVLKNISHKNTLLIGDAAGFCGAFAADGIKGAVISGKEATPLIAAYLDGDNFAPKKLKEKINQRGGLIRYYKKQLLYRWVWDLMKKDRSFRAMFNIIAAERESFLEQFCDSKDKHKSLSRTVLKIKHLTKLIKYAWCLFLDQVKI